MGLNRAARLYVYGCIALANFLHAGVALAQPASVQQMQALAQSMAANQQRLGQYQWIEVRQVTIDGNDGPKVAFRCQYGADGNVVRAPVNGPAPQQGFDFNTEVTSRSTRSECSRWCKAER